MCFTEASCCFPVPLGRREIMHEATEKWQVLILGGGLAGLSAALLLSKAGMRVAVIEKKTYPFHKVCGEYISTETLPFFQRLGVDPFALGAKAISRFRLSGPSGTYLELPLEQGGFGLSRYRMDHALYQLAEQQGVTFFQKESVVDIDPEQGIVTTNKRSVEAELLIGAFGKRSLIDQKLDRSFLKQRSPFVGVKYHLRSDHPADLIELHNFKNGYLGINQIEDDLCCTAYLASRKDLKAAGSIDALEKQVLSRNPQIKRMFEQSEKVYEQPLVINEVSLAQKPLVEQGLFMAGDSAGMIAPLAGNGMAIAMHSGKILAELILADQQGPSDRKKLAQEYEKQWRKQFSARLRMGRTIHRFFGNETITDLVVGSFRRVPALAKLVIRQTHGKPF